MVSLGVESIQGNLARSIEAPSSPRISFSAEFLGENNFISISPKYQNEEDEGKECERARNAAEFEFLSNNNNIGNNEKVLTTDELFFQGKLLSFWEMQHLEKLYKINLKATNGEEEDEKEEVNRSSNKVEKESRSVNWFVDDDASPRPPKCIVLWKELLRFKKQRSSSSLSPSTSLLGDVVVVKEGTASTRNKEESKRTKKVLERTRSSTIRIRPMINVPICTQVKSNTLPSPFSLNKGRLER